MLTSMRLNTLMEEKKVKNEPNVCPTCRAKLEHLTAKVTTISEDGTVWLDKDGRLCYYFDDPSRQLFVFTCPACQAIITFIPSSAQKTLEGKEVATVCNQQLYYKTP